MAQNYSNIVLVHIQILFAANARLSEVKSAGFGDASKHY